MLFALTRSNLLKQLPDLNQITLRLFEIVTTSDSIKPKADKLEHHYGNSHRNKTDGFAKSPDARRANL